MEQDLFHAVHSFSFCPAPFPFIASDLPLSVVFCNILHHIRYTFQALIQWIALKSHLVHIIPADQSMIVRRNISGKTRYFHYIPAMYPVMISRFIDHIRRNPEIMRLCQRIVVWEQPDKYFLFISSLRRTCIRYLSATAVGR